MSPTSYPYEQENELQKAFRNYPFTLKQGDYFIVESSILNSSGIFYVVSVVPFWKRTEQGYFIYWSFVIQDVTSGIEMEIDYEPPFSTILNKEIAEVLYGF